jgi:flagellar basal body rod protein FlgG
MRSNEKRMEAISANLANLDTNAYKRQGSVTQAFEVGNGAGRVRQIETHHSTDFTQGVLKRTGNPYDFALDGDGFFVVDGAKGESYTRNGAFHIDENGALHTADGLPVAWEGAPGVIAPIGESVNVDGSGNVRQGSNSIGRLRVVDFADKQRLTLDEQGYFHAPRGLKATASSANVHQGALERSNSQSVDELVAMVRVQRNFESAANLMRSIDQSYKRLNTPR